MGRGMLLFGMGGGEGEPVAETHGLVPARLDAEARPHPAGGMASFAESVANAF